MKMVKNYEVRWSPHDDGETDSKLTGKAENYVGEPGIL